MSDQFDENKVDVKKALRVFQLILDKGEKDGDVYRMEGLEADPGVDGYVATLKNDYVSLDIQFHSQYNLSSASQLEQDRFLEKIDRLDAAHNREVHSDM